MINKKKAFRDILLVELNDLDEDIKVLIEQCQYKYQHNEISDYVCLENLAVLRNELFGIKSFLYDVNKINSDDYKTIEELMNYLLNILDERIHEKGLVPSVRILIEKRMKKVTKYLKE